MVLGLNLISPVASGSSSMQTDQTNEASNEYTGATSASNNSTAAEPSSGASQTSEAKPTQTVPPVNTDIAVSRSDKPDIAASEEAAQLNETLARQFAVRARAETIVAALVEAISAPIQPSEIAAVEAAEAELKKGVAQQTAVQQESALLEGGPSSAVVDN